MPKGKNYTGENRRIRNSISRYTPFCKCVHPGVDGTRQTAFQSQDTVDSSKQLISKVGNWHSSRPWSKASFANISWTWVTRLHLCILKRPPKPACLRFPIEQSSKFNFEQPTGKVCHSLAILNHASFHLIWPSLKINLILNLLYP